LLRLPILGTRCWIPDGQVDTGYRLRVAGVSIKPNS
jgi:hypothetical protein